jgi:uncharacterized protein (DUF1015 family)
MISKKSKGSPMNKYNTIFSPAEILLPKFTTDSEKMTKWAVIACDQFTSQPAYWEACKNNILDSDSTLNYILPEAYLESELEASHASVVSTSMKTFTEDSMTKLCGMIYVERVLPNGKIRHGLVGKIDLEAYNFEKGSTSPVRATEATVIERIPPRRRIREDAVVELPHILILISDKNGIFAHLDEHKSAYTTTYDFDLMQGGGHIRGYHVGGENLTSLMCLIEEFEKSSGSVTYAMGDGNHSLAAAKAHWENVKKNGDLNHPARYALCEIGAIEDDSLEFEPIYRVIKNCDVADFTAQLDKITSSDSNSSQSITVITGDVKKSVTFTNPTHALTVGTLQDFIDAYVRSNPGVVCDYIHGEDVLCELSKEEGCVGISMAGMDKSELIPYVEAHGTLPRKTFSMGEAESKRYYLEMRKITL